MAKNAKTIDIGIQTEPPAIQWLEEQLKNIRLEPKIEVEPEDVDKLYPINIEGLEKYSITKDGRVWTHHIKKFIKINTNNNHPVVRIKNKSYRIPELLESVFGKEEKKIIVRPKRDRNPNTIKTKEKGKEPEIQEDLCDIPVDGLENYLITRTGKIWSKSNNSFLSTYLNNGYARMSTLISGKTQTFGISRLVAITFIPNPNKYTDVRHKNNISTDDTVENLEWSTRKIISSSHDKNISHPREVEKLENGNVIATFNSVTEAGESVGVTRHAIAKVCNGINKSCKGYLWRYKDSNNNREKDIDISNGKLIYDYDNYYVFRNGDIYSSSRKKYLKPVENKKGYCYVTLCKNNIKQNCYIHTIVVDHYLEKQRDKDLQVNHINKIRNDNRVENLEIVTPSENIKHARNYKASNTKLPEKSDSGSS